ncbi:MAG: hypothetical protein ACRCWJ_19260 [Casimicrobium sp.]
MFVGKWLGRSVGNWLGAQGASRAQDDGPRGGHSTYRAPQFNDNDDLLTIVQALFVAGVFDA